MHYRHFLTHYTPAILSALLVYSAFPPLNLWGMMAIALIPFIWGLKKLYSLKSHLLYFFLFGIIYMGLMHIWLLELKPYSSGIGISSLVIIYTIFLSLYYVATGALYYISGRHLWTLPFCWIIGEWLRSITIVGNPTGSLCYSQSYNPIILQWTGIIGPFGVSFIIIGLSCLLYNCLLYKRLLTKKYRTYYGLSLLFIVSIGLWQLNTPLPTTTHHTAAIIQGNHAQSTKLDRKQWPAIIKTYLRLTEETLQKTPTQFVIWPETIIPALNLKNKQLLNQIQYLSHHYKTNIIFGTPSKLNQKYLNTLAIMTPTGLHTQQYHKIRLMPFGEYWPGKSILQQLGLGQLLPGAEYSSGPPRQKALHIDNTIIGTGLCLESIYPWFYQKMKSQNTQFMLTLANNAWFGNSSGAEKHFQMSLFRSVENQSYFIQAANTGISAIISPKGIPIKQSKLNTQDTLTSTIYDSASKSIYNTIGDIIVYIGFLVILVMMTPIIK